ncbi:type I-E CRISPR-associated protein Cse1/CasA [Streptomyces antarcticus]|uniref:type I-E CRISPR-associated protein Cse1/CasA n=1 Tax=Streptomyces antarcticus TaxID=2996458 RepID=UPI00226E1AAF|nr:MULTISPECIES: type I-E CRISPR-associated protein Cse1/CasA [unclassified Streptomyces]MCY0947653.1 type I-E CRISPR-associated protein Cse1/CasA [Streptomyces sp. H34-AA3]MCZ4087464.1 type I-E CRISPR-associated protein Cse1/CasA [Streptomyces sp. H34-S5]
MRPRWDPREKACIPVLTLDDRLVELSLVDVLHEADALRSVEGATPGEKIAVIEFLLAICYASGTYPASAADWPAWVDQEHALRPAARWLGERPQDEVWDLFHPTQPLGQNALLAPFLDEHGAGPAQLVIEQVGDYNQFFDHHHLDHPRPLPAALAFRAMLAQHIYGPAGRARISGKATLGATITNLAATRLGTRIRVIALGVTLGETLRLNLAPVSGPSGELNLSWTTGKERRGFTRKPDGRPVSGPADLHSYLGRSVLLRPTPEGDVDRVLLGAGELLALRDEHLQDAVYARRADGSAKPLWASATRAVWREAHALYAAVDKARSSKSVNDGATLYRRLALFPAEDVAPEPGQQPARRIELWTVGLVAKQTTAITWVDGTFPFAPGLEARLYHASFRGSEVAEFVAAALYKAAYKAWTVAYPNPKPADKNGQVARFDARSRHWAATREPFDLLMDDTTLGEPVQECLLDFAADVSTAARRFLTESLDSLPRNSQGAKARSAALRRFDDELALPKAPAELRELREERA